MKIITKLYTVKLIPFSPDQNFRPIAAFLSKTLGSHQFHRPAIFDQWQLSFQNTKVSRHYSCQVRLREAENEETIRKLREKLEEVEEERRREREEQPAAPVASLQELLAASKLREAEASLALKDLRSKLGELNTMWQKHLKRADTAPKVTQKGLSLFCTLHKCILEF